MIKPTQVHAAYRIRFIWTCCDYCKVEHKSKAAAWLHGRYKY